MVVVDIRSITWSDHVPIFLTLNLGMTPTRVCHWCLNESLLKRLQHREELKKSVTDYFQITKGLVSSQAAFWEAQKVVIRGHCIAIGARFKKYVTLQVNTLNLQLQSLESRLASKPYKLPKLPTEAVDHHNAPITVDEIQEVLKLLPSAKSPSFNLTLQCFPEYYVTFLHHLNPKT